MARKKISPDDVKKLINNDTNKFKDLYYKALHDFELVNLATDDYDMIFGSSKGFMDKLQHSFEQEYVNVKDNTNPKKVSKLLYALEPKCLMDVFWIGHFLGSKHMMDWTQGNLNFGQELLDEFTDSLDNDGVWEQ